MPTTYVSVEEQGVVCWPSNWRFHYGWHLLRHAVYLLTSCTSAWTHHQHSNRVYRPPAVCPKRWMMRWPSFCPWAPGHLEMPHRKKEKTFKESYTWQKIVFTWRHADCLQNRLVAKDKEAGITYSRLSFILIVNWPPSLHTIKYTVKILWNVNVNCTLEFQLLVAYCTHPQGPLHFAHCFATYVAIKLCFILCYPVFFRNISSL